MLDEKILSELSDERTASNITEESSLVVDIEDELGEKLPGKSLFMFNCENPVRRKAAIIVFSIIF